MQIWMLNDSTHEQLRDPATAMLWHDKNIRHVGDGGEIRNNSGKANLSPTEKRTKAKRMLDRPLDDSSRDALRPVGGAQKIVNQPDIQTAAVGGNFIMRRCLHARALRCLRTQAQRPGPRRRSIATGARWPGSLQRMIRPMNAVKHVVPRASTPPLSAFWAEYKSHRNRAF